MTEPEAPHHAFEMFAEAPIAECKFCYNKYKTRVMYDEFGDKYWGGKFCSKLCMRLWYEEQREKK